MRSKICLPVIFVLVFANALLAIGCTMQLCRWHGLFYDCTKVKTIEDPSWTLSPDKYDWNAHIAWHRDNCENTDKDEEKNMAHWKSWAHDFTYDNTVVKPDPFCIKGQPADSDAGVESTIDNDE
jgi:hypothetical protein